MQPDIQLPKTPAIKIAKGRITQSGTNAPVVTYQQNNIGNIVWTRDSVGYFQGALAGAFTTGKVWANIGKGSGYQDSPGATTAFYIFQGFGDENNIFITSEYNGELTDGMLTENDFEIYIYK